MIIVHVSLNSPYNDYWGYQENLLPKYQSRLGNTVHIITTTLIHYNGKIKSVLPQTYTLQEGVTVHRIQKKSFCSKKLTEILNYYDIYDLLCKLKPDYIFFHGCMNWSIYDVVKYKNKYKCFIAQDNHLDNNIGYSSITFKDKIRKLYYILLNMHSKFKINVFYGVTPCRIQYLSEYFHIRSNNIKLLIMGADDEAMHIEDRSIIRYRTRKELNVSDKEFVLVSGGKFDLKKGIGDLMDAVNSIQSDSVRLVLFGSPQPEFMNDFSLKLSNKIIYIGWIKASDVYKYFYAADLIVFPGQHSVLWEQAAASKTPCVFKKWDGMNHINNGGNSMLIDCTNCNYLTKVIESLLFTDKYYKLLEKARSSITDIYLYSNIAAETFIDYKNYH